MTTEPTTEEHATPSEQVSDQQTPNAPVDISIPTGVNVIGSLFMLGGILGTIIAFMLLVKMGFEDDDDVYIVKSIMVLVPSLFYGFMGWGLLRGYTWARSAYLIFTPLVIMINGIVVYVQETPSKYAITEFFLSIIIYVICVKALRSPAANMHFGTEATSATDDQPLSQDTDISNSVASGGCPACGSELPANAEVCPSCSLRFTEDDVDQSQPHAMSIRSVD